MTDDPNTHDSEAPEQEPQGGWKDRARALAGKVKDRVGARPKDSLPSDQMGERSEPTLDSTDESPWTSRLKDFMATRVLEPLAEKSKQWQVRDKLTQALPRDVARSFPTTFEPLAIAEWVGQAFQQQGAAFYGRLLTIVLSTWFLADLTALLIDSYIPEPPISHAVHRGGGARRLPTLDDYNIIFARNLFNSKGLIPGEEANSTPGSSDNCTSPTRSTLPFNLIGTVILQDELRSIASIEDKSASLVYPVRIADEIPTKARIVKIEASKVIFSNTSTGRCEFIDLPEDAIQKITLKGIAANPGIERDRPDHFNIDRKEVDKTLSDLNQVLTQARCVPNFENGQASGFKCFQIVPGSIYDKLGMQNGDVLCGLNGDPINDPGKAFQMLSELKTSNHIELCIKRDGKQTNYAYDIH